MHALDGTHATIGIRVEVTQNKGWLVRTLIEFLGKPVQLFVSQNSLSSGIQQQEVSMRQFNHARLNADLLLLQERGQRPQILPIVVIADRHVDGNSSCTNRFKKPE